MLLGRQGRINWWVVEEAVSLKDCCVACSGFSRISLLLLGEWAVVPDRVPSIAWSF